jgi:hypothetical protein
MGLKLNQAQKIIKLAKRLAAAENVVSVAQAQGQKPSLEQTRNAHKAFRTLHVYVHQLAGAASQGVDRKGAGE